KLLRTRIAKSRVDLRRPGTRGGLTCLSSGRRGNAGNIRETEPAQTRRIRQRRLAKPFQKTIRIAKSAERIRHRSDDVHPFRWVVVIFRIKPRIELIPILENRFD